MPWCSVCAKEYGKGTKRCPICGSKLQRKAPDNTDLDEPAWLTTTDDNAMLGMMEEVLNDADIPTLTKPHDLGEALMAYTGSIQMGADIYVPSKMLNKARDVIRNLTEALPAETAEDEDEED